MPECQNHEVCVQKPVILFAIILTIASLNLTGVLALHSAPQQVPDSTSQQQREMEDRMQHEANKKRQEEIRHDTDKLYQLATELKNAVDKTNENMLSLDVVRKAEEVEKLAKKVKEKMREGSGRPLKPEPPPVEIPRPIGPG